MIAGLFDVALRYLPLAPRSFGGLSHYKHNGFVNLQSFRSVFFGTPICQILFSVRRQPFWKYLRAMVNRFYGKKTQSCHVSCRAFLSEVLLPPGGIAGGPRHILVTKVFECAAR